MNPAERLLSIYDKLVSQQKDQSMTQTWATVFELDNKDPHLEDIVVACVVALRQQIDFSRLKLTEKNVPLELTSPGFDNLKSIASPGNLNSSWNGLRGNIQPPECRHAFKWASWVLREQVENEISAEDLIELQKEISDLEKIITVTDMSSTLRNFILQQIASIKEALVLASVQGARPIRESYEKIAGAFILYKDAIEPEAKNADVKTKTVINKLGKIIKKFAEAGEVVENLKSLGINVASAAAYATPLLISITT